MKECARSSWIWLALLCVYGFVHSASYALTNPVCESPDEPGHLAFINRIAAGKGLPNQYNPAELMAEGHQNPLYYGSLGVVLRALGGPIVVDAKPSLKPDKAPQFRHDRNPFPSPRDRTLFFAIRLLGSLLVALTVLLVGRAARAAIPGGYAWLIAPMLVATLPELAFIGGSITNDGLVACMGAGALYAAARCLSEPGSRRAWIAMGIWTGFAFLAKKNALCLAPAGLVFLVVQAFVEPRTRRPLLKAGLLGAGAALLLMFPVFLRNLLVYKDLFGNRMEVETLQDLVYPQGLNSRHFRVLFPDIVPRSFVAHFGWMIVEVTPKYVWIVVRGILAGTLLSGIAFADKKRAPMLAYAWTAFLLNVAGLVYYNLFFPQAQGRLLFPALAAIMLLCAVGVSELSRRISAPYKWAALVPIALALIWFDWFALLTNQAFYALHR